MVSVWTNEKSPSTPAQDTKPWREEKSTGGETQDTQNTEPPEAPIILVLGLTGAGKTTFINHVAQQLEPRPVGHGMTACTTSAEVILARVGGVGVVLVDTPGFEDPERSDAEVLINVTTWMSEHLGGKIKITAALYLSSIATEKMYGSALQNFFLFTKIVGSGCMANVGLVSTRWDVVDRDTAEARERELIEKPWKTMIENGARTFRAANDAESCCRILQSLLEAQPTFIQIQREMAREFDGKPLPRTMAGEQVHAQVLADIASAKAEIALLEGQLRNGAQLRDMPSLKEQLEENLRSARERLSRLDKDRQRVEKVPTWQEWAWKTTKSCGPAVMSSALSWAMKTTQRGPEMAELQALRIAQQDAQMTIDALQRQLGEQSNMGGHILTGVTYAAIHYGLKAFGWM